MRALREVAATLVVFLITRSTAWRPLGMKTASFGEGDARRFAPAAERNKDVIVEVVAPRLKTGEVTVLEVASGTGQHAAHFAAQLGARLRWQPTEFDEDLLSSISAYGTEKSTDAGEILEPFQLDVQRFAAADESVAEETLVLQQLHEDFRAGVDVVFNANMIHISPWDCTKGLFAMGSAVVKPGGLCILYGPFRRNGFMVESNQQFDASLRSRNVDWGVRDLEEVVAVAESCGFLLEEVVEMPANNLTVFFRRAANED